MKLDIPYFELGDVRLFDAGIIGPTGRSTPNLSRVCYHVGQRLIRGEVGLVRPASDEQRLAGPVVVTRNRGGHNA